MTPMDHGAARSVAGNHERSSRRRWSAAILLAILLVPFVRDVMEASMLAQMLVQIPLLAVAGWLARSCLTIAARARIAAWNASGITGFIVASVTSACWMLPRALDSAVADPVIDAAKYLSVPLLLGLPLSLSWPQAGFVARGVFLAEAVASLFRLGWLYRVSPVRLCSAYPLADQQQLGLCMLAIGGMLVAAIAWRLLFGDLRHAGSRTYRGMIT